MEDERQQKSMIFGSVSSESFVSYVREFRSVNPKLMKKKLLITVIIIFILIVSGCSENQFTETNQQKNEQVQDEESSSKIEEKEIISLLSQCELKSITVPDKFGPHTLSSELFDEEFGEERKRTEMGFLNASTSLSRVFIVCEHYDFSAGTEFDSFANREDYEAYPSGYVKEFVGNFGHNENSAVKKVAIFPRKDAYLAIVYEKFSESPDKELEALKKGEGVKDEQSLWNSIDEIARSVTFRR